MHKKKWSDLSREQRRVAVVVGVVEAILLLFVQVDLSRRSSDEVRGKKALWRLLAFVQPFGPIAYLRYGRLPRSSTA